MCFRGCNFGCRAGAWFFSSVCFFFKTFVLHVNAHRSFFFILFLLNVTMLRDRTGTTVRIALYPLSPPPGAMLYPFFLESLFLFAPRSKRDRFSEYISGEVDPLSPTLLRPLNYIPRSGFPAFSLSWIPDCGFFPPCKVGFSGEGGSNSFVFKCTLIYWLQARPPPLFLIGNFPAQIHMVASFFAKSSSQEFFYSNFHMPIETFPSANIPSLQTSR